MSTPFIGRMFFEVALPPTGSPLVYTRFCEVNEIGGVGEASSNEDVTTFCSGGTREVIPGLADGSEPNISAFYATDAPVIDAMIAAQKAKSTLDFRIAVDSNADNVMEKYFYFRAALLSWELAPSVDSPNGINFGLKISGAIDYTNGP